MNKMDVIESIDHNQYEEGTLPLLVAKDQHKEQHVFVSVGVYG